jgi:hypothetical protein
MRFFILIIVFRSLETVSRLSEKYHLSPASAEHLQAYTFLRSVLISPWAIRGPPDARLPENDTQAIASAPNISGIKMLFVQQAILTEKLLSISENAG